MEDKTSNSIALYQCCINELEELRKKVQASATEDIRFVIQTRHWYGYSEPFLKKENTRIDISKYTMEVVIDEAINKQRERINKLIDMEIESRKTNHCCNCGAELNKDNTALPNMCWECKYGIDE